MAKDHHEPERPQGARAQKEVSLKHVPDHAERQMDAPKGELKLRVSATEALADALNTGSRKEESRDSETGWPETTISLKGHKEQELRRRCH